MFKLLTLRILDDCAGHIQRCLNENEYYYFCTDYRFEEAGKIYRGNQYAKPLTEDFFSVPNPKPIPSNPKPSPVINISAIVGKNGDGKSTIVELIIRMVNNYIVRKQKNKEYKGNRDLLPIDKVYAELYFLQDNLVYKMFEDKKGNYGIHEIADISQFAAHPELQYLSLYAKDAPDALMSIYTFVSNYSLYAYNVYDFGEEWDRSKPLDTEEQQNEACWLYHVFHKSDGYLTPLALHPYRRSGLIDINLEKSLVQQRLISLFINADEKSYSFRDVFDKRAVALKFADPGFSKLQKVTLKQYLESTWTNDLSIEWAIDEISKAKSKPYTKENYEEILVQLSKVHIFIVQNIINKLIGSDDPNYARFLAEMNSYLQENVPQTFPHKSHGKYKSQQSNIARYIHSLSRLQSTLRNHHISFDECDPYLHIRTQKKEYKAYIRYNTVQLARILLIYQVAQEFEIDPYIIFVKYEDLSEYQKCQHYIIYKVISIINKYPDYRNMMYHNPMEEPFEATDYELQQIFPQINKDIKNGTHITRKLAQAIRFTKTDGKENPNFYIERGSKAGVPLDEQDNAFSLGLGKIKRLKAKLKSDELPPAIYNYEIIFQSEDGSYMGMNTLSSGEKQLLNTLGAIIYHIQNIDSARSVHYKSINLILEEIELYFHPEYQRQFVKRLIRQIHGADLHKIENINITFVTHSPFILSDVPKCNVLFLKDGKPDYGMQENTFGANIHSILKNGFFLPNLPMGDFAHDKIDDLFRTLNGHLFLDEDKERIQRIRQEIALIGEPYLREQLYRLLPNR